MRERLDIECMVIYYMLGINYYAIIMSRAINVDFLYCTLFFRRFSNHLGLFDVDTSCRFHQSNDLSAAYILAAKRVNYLLRV